MATIEETQAGEQTILGDVKYCRSCFRDDIHFEVGFPPFILGFSIVMTMGLVMLVRPSRCVCCGKTRIF